MRLIQMAGRLIRRENDRGLITILDKRLWQSLWGAKMLKSLPAYKKREEKPEDRRPLLVTSEAADPRRPIL